MTAKLSSLESSLDELGVRVSRVETDSFHELIDETVTAPAVGVALDETFDESALSLTETTITVDPTPAALRKATTGVTGARLGVADYGSLVLSVTDRASELVSLFVDRHVAVLREDDVVADMDAAIEILDEGFNRTGGSSVVATGPSATADMGALVKGAHGPRDVHVIILEEGA